MKPFTKKGIVLITTLSIMTFLVMLSTMLISSGYSSLRRASTYLENELAHHAAMSGLAYAQARLERKLSWTAQESAFAAEKAGIVIQESNGVVVGTITSSNGTVSKFRMAFMDNDDARNAGVRYISYNPGNLADGYVTYTRDAEIAKSTLYTKYRKVPKNTVTVVVEGVVYNSGGKVIATRVVESSFVADYSQLLDAVAFSGNDLNVEATDDDGAWELAVEKDHREFLAETSVARPGIRPLGNVNLKTDRSVAKDAYQNKDDLEIMMWPGSDKRFTLNNVVVSEETESGYNVQRSTSEAETKSKFPRLTEKEAFSGEENNTKDFDTYFPASERNEIKAGTYLYGMNGNALTLEYFPGVVHDGDTSNDSKYEIQGNQNQHVIVERAFPNKKYTSDQSFTGDSMFSTKSLKISIDRPTSVITSSKNVNGLSILTDPNANMNRPQVTLSSTKTTPGVIYSPGGDLVVAGDITGQGTVVSGGDLTFQGHSVMEPSEEGGVSVFARNSIKLQPIASNVTGTGTTGISNSSTANSLTQTVLSVADGALSSVKVTNMERAVALVKTSKLPGSSSYKNLESYLRANKYNKADVKAIIQLTLQKNIQIATDRRITIRVGAASGGTAMQSLTYQDQQFAGLMYAGRNFEVDAGTHSFMIQGALVAFGNSKVADDNNEANKAGKYAEPGAVTGTGNINLKGHTVNFTYDPDTLSGYFNIRSSGIPVVRSYFASY